MKDCMLPSLKIQRICTGIHGTFGVMMQNGWPFALSLEDPWLNNRPFESCIPTGLYKCKRIISPKFGTTFEVQNVEDRTHILFHVGNTIDDVSGCIAVGEEFGVFNGHPSVMGSSRGFMDFMGRYSKYKEFELSLTWGM